MQVTLTHRWVKLQAWLRSSDAHYFLDEAVLGGMPLWEAEEVLADYGLPVTKENLRELGRQVNRALSEGH